MRKTSSTVTSSSKRSTQFSPSRQRLLFALLTFSSLTSGGAALAAGGSLPTGGHFVGGAGAITSSGNSLTVNQSTQIGIINWQSFSIGKGDSVSIANGKGATLNRVTGGNISTIAGSLKSTGSVYVVNQAGMVVGPGGKVVTNGSFVASTRDVSDATFMAGGNIDLSGTSSGTVVNQGSITSTNGNVVLVGKSVTNSGSVSAAKGDASLVAGDNVLLQASGDDAVLVETGSGDVTNTGTVAAAQIALNAAGGNVYALAVNNGGVIRATGTKTQDGHVYLTAGDDLTVNSSVSATNADGSGGTIVATASTVTVGGKARVSADGTGSAAGGTILIGGDRHGGTDPSVALSKTPIANAKTTTVAAQAQISADGGVKGNGGNVVVWSDDVTTYAGRISAKGGGTAGNGGFVEVSGKDGLAFTGTVITMGRHGNAGTLLLDPSDVTIVSSTDPGGNTTTSGESQTGGTFNPTTGTSFILNTDIDAALASNNVVINTGSLTDGLGGAGNIQIGTNNGAAFLHAAPIFWNTSNSLTLNAVGIITSPGGNPNNTTGGAPPSPNASGVYPLIDSEGGGAIFFNAGGNGQSAGSTVISLQGNIQGSGGLISLAATTPSMNYRIELNNGQGITNTAQSGAGTVILEADEVHLGTSTGPSGFVTTPGEVDIVPTTAGAVVIGDNNPAGDYSATANTALIRTEDVVNITANLLVIGSTSTTSLKFETVDPAGDIATGGGGNFGLQFDALGVNNLKLLTGTAGSVSQDANTAIIVNDPAYDFTSGPNPGAGGLAVQTGGTITLNNSANSVGSIAFKQTGAGGAISFTTAASTNGTLVVGTVADLSGISTVGTLTPVTITASGDAVTQTAGVANAIAPSSGSIALDLEGTTSSFTLDNPANTVTTAAATVASLTLYDNIGLSTATVGSSSGLNATGNVTVVDNGLLTIGNGAGITTTGGSVKVEDQTFTNSDAGNAFNVTGGGTWRVYSQDPTMDSDNGSTLTYSFVQYNAANSYADPFTTANAALNSGATGNGFIYTIAPTLKETVAGQFNKPYDGNATVTGTLVAGDYTVTVGGINNDQIKFTNPMGTGAGVATYATQNAGNNIAISLTNPVTFGAKDSNNVQIFGYGLTVTDNLTGNITPLDVTVSGTRSYDGLTDASGSILTVSGEISGDPTLTVTGSGTLSSKNANTTATNISGLGTLALSGTGSGNYVISSGTVLVTPLDVTVTGTRSYDGLTDASGTILTVSGEIGGDPTLTVTGSGTLSSKNANTTATNISGLGTLALSGTGSGNYVISSGTVLVTPLDVTVTGTRSYDGLTDASGTILTVSGEIGGDPTLTVTGSGTLAGKNANTTATNISGLGTLALSGTGSGNYTIISGTVLVTPKDVTLTGTRTYDGLTDASGTILTVSGEIGGDPTLTVTGSGTLSSKNANTTATNISSLGTLALSGTGSGNYVISSGTVLVTPLDVTVTGTRTYDGLTDASGSILTVSGEISGDPTLTVTGSGTLSSKNANTTATNISGLGTLALSGTGSGNYVISSGTVLVTPLDVTVTGTRSYDGLTDASGTILTVSGEIGGDPTLTVTGSGTLSSKNANTTATNISGLGTLALSGTGSGNYTIASGTVLVTPIALTITAGDQTKTYGQTATLGTTDYTVGSGLVSGETITSVTLTSTGTIATANVGAYNIVGAGATGAGGFLTSNYTITYDHGTLTVNPAVLTVTPVAVTRTYDGTTLNNTTYSDSTGNYTFSGFVNGQNLTSADIGLTGSMAFDGSTTTVVKNAATYSQGAGTLGLISNNGNYTLNFSNPTPNNYVITPLGVTIAMLAGTRVYDGMTDANGSILSITDLVSPTDQVTLTGSGILISKNVGRETISSLGTLTLHGADAGNYTLVGATGYVDVTKATLTVTAVTQTRVYDGTTISTMTPTIAGLQTGDSTTGTLEQSYGSRNVLGTNGSTLAALQDIGVSDGNGGGNYTIVYKTAKGTITPEHVTVTATPNTKTYDGTETATATPTVTAGMIFDPDTGTFIESYNQKNVGTGLTLTPTGSISDGNGGKNYIVTYVPISGSRPGTGGKAGIIDPALLTISAVTQTKVYDGNTTSTDTPIITVGDLFGGDTLTDLSQAFNSKNVLGTNGSILSVNPHYVLTDASDYKVTLKTAPGTITPLVITATSTRVYNGTPDVDGSILSITDLVPGDEIGITGTGTSGNKNVGTHDVTGDLTLTGTDAKNYTLTGGTETVKITPFAVVLTGTRVYDGQTDGDSGILSVTNAFAGDTVTVDSGTSTIISRNVGNEKIVNFGTLTLGGASSGDYTLVGAKGNVIVTPEMLVVTAVPTTKPEDGNTTSPGTPIVTSGTIFGPDTGGFVQTYGNTGPGNNITLTPGGSVNDGNGGNNYIVTFVPITTGVITDTPTTPDVPPIQIPNTQTASGEGASQNFIVPDSGLISLTPRQNGVVTGTIATIDGTDYHPDSQLGCTLGAAGCIQNGVAPTTTSAPPQ
jgi:filamentous hemagglutinin family protein